MLASLANLDVKSLPQRLAVIDVLASGYISIVVICVP